LDALEAFDIAQKSSSDEINRNTLKKGNFEGLCESDNMKFCEAENDIDDFKENCNKK